MTYMNDVERRILTNQLQILSMLDRRQVEDYERSIRMLSDTGNDADALGPVRQIAMAEVDGPMTFAFRILSFYAFLQNSFYALDLKEKIQIDHTALVFPGFHEDSEQNYSDHVSFIRDSLGQFSLLETRKHLTPQEPMTPFYRGVLALRPSRSDALLDFGGITEMIAAIEELQTKAANERPELETATAA